MTQHQRKIPLGQRAVLFSGIVIAIIEKCEAGDLTPERALEKITAYVHELPVCVKPEEGAEEYQA